MSQIRNYDIDKLTFWIAEPGFILGEGILGVNKLGGDGTPTQLDADFVGFTLNAPVNVDNGLFLSRDVRTFSLQARIPTLIDLDGKRLIVKYDAIVIFKGTIRNYEMTETWTEQANPIGGLPYKSISLSLTATSGEDRFGQAMTPPKNFNDVSTRDRLLSWLSASTYTESITEAADIDVGNIANMKDAISKKRLQYASDSYPSLIETIKDQLRLTNYNYRHEPWDSKVILNTNARWLSGTNQATSLTFSDNPADITKTGGDSFVYDTNTVGYTDRTVSKNDGYFVRGVTVTITDNAEVTTTYGPYRVTNSFPQDVDINIGRNSLAAEWLARLFASNLPLKRSSEPFTTRLHTRLQSRKQLGSDAEGPGMAVLKANGVTSRVAILSVTHSCTRDLWTVDYEVGPEHLISRASDPQRYVVTDMNVTQTGPTQVNMQWTTPKFDSPPSAMYVHIASVWTNPVTSWNITTVLYSALAKAPGVPESVFMSPFSAGSHSLVIFYSTDDTTDNSGTPNAHVQGPPTFFTFATT